MRCKACNTALEQFEIDRKPIYRNYIDMQDEAEFIQNGLVL